MPMISTEEYNYIRTFDQHTALLDQWVRSDCEDLSGYVLSERFAYLTCTWRLSAQFEWSAVKASGRPYYCLVWIRRSTDSRQSQRCTWPAVRSWREALTGRYTYTWHTCWMTKARVDSEPRLPWFKTNGDGMQRSSPLHTFGFSMWIQNLW